MSRLIHSNQVYDYRLRRLALDYANRERERKKKRAKCDDFCADLSSESESKLSHLMSTRVRQGKVKGQMEKVTAGSIKREK